MTNILFTADIHVADYSLYNITPGARLGQFPKLAHRIVELGKENHCDILVMAGDTIDHPVMLPPVQHTLKDVLQTLTEGFSRVWFILGQHDIASKGEVSERDTIMTLFKDKKIEYVDHQVKTVGSTKFGFMNWSEHQDLSWLSEPVDVMVGHLTKFVGGSSQDVDESKFHDFIHGDIHNDQVLQKSNHDGGSYISISNPIQHRMGDIPDGSVIVYDCDSKSWKRVPVDPDHSRFLRLEYTQETNKKGWSEDHLTYFVIQPPKAQPDAEVVSVDENGEPVSPIDFTLPERTKDVFKDALSVIEEKGLLDIHEEVAANVTEPKVTDFDFRLKNIKIHGFGSIVDFEYNFKEGERIIITGENGSGKSTLLTALRKAFEKDSQLKSNYTSWHTDDISVDVTLEYQGLEYRILRGTKFGLWINGVAQKYNNKNDFDKDVESRLPVCEWVNLMFQSPDASNLMTQLSSSDKVAVLAQFYHLDAFENYYDSAMGKVSELKDELSGADKKIAAKQAAIEVKKLNIEEDKPKVVGMSVDKISTKLAQLRSMSLKADNYNKWKSTVSNIEMSLRSAENAVSQKESECAGIDMSQLDGDIAKASALIDDLQKQLLEKRELWNAYTSVKADFNAALAEGKSIKASIDSVKESGKCPTCGQPLHNCDDGLMQTLQSKRQAALAKYNEAKAALDSATESLGAPEQEFLDAMKAIEERIRNGHAYKGTAEANKKQADLQLATLSRLRSNLDSVRKSLEDKRKDAPEEAQFTEEDRKEMFDKQLSLEICKRVARLEEELGNDELELADLNAKRADVETHLARMRTYAELVSPSGQVYKKSMASIAAQFTDNLYKYEVVCDTYRGKPRCLFNTYMFQSGHYAEYRQMSSAQKALADIDFLSKLFVTPLGIFCMDEGLRYYRGESITRAAERLSNLNCRIFIISSNEDYFPMDGATYLRCSLDEEGRTIIAKE